MNVGFSIVSRGTLALAMTVAGLSQLGCGAGDESDATVPLGEENGELWSRSGTVFWGVEVPVCWTSATWNDANLATWRNNVRLWTTDRISRYANVYFTGWGQCAANPGANVIKVTRVTTGNSNAFFIGYSSTENKIDFGNDSNAQGVVLHEFMHKLGFDHEFNRLNDSDNCSPRQISVTGTNWTPYDNASIMNSTYCHSNADLSPWDIIGLQQVYGRKHAGSMVGHGGLCLNVSGGGNALGTPLIGWPCVGLPNDTWSFQTSGLVRATISGQQRCVNISGGVVNPNASTPLGIWSCSTGDANSLFHLTGVQWRAMGNMCLTATSSSAGAAIDIRTCGTSPTRELWDFFEGSNRIRLNGTNLCVEVPNGATALGTELRLATCANVTRQTFSYANGEINFTSNRCFNVLGGVPTPGSRLALWDGCGFGHANEYFSTSGLVHGLGQCMDMLGGQAFIGNGTGVYPCVPSAINHRWEYHW